MHTESVIAGVQKQRESLLRRVALLADADWDLQCPAPVPPPDVVRLEEPQRTVREIVAHLLVVDEMVLRGGTLRALGGRRALEHPGAWDLRRVGPLASATPTELVPLLAQSGKRFLRFVEAAPAPLRRVPVRGPFGRQPLDRLLTRRVLHEWLHEQDIAAGATPDAPAGQTAHPAVAEAIATAVLQLLPSDILPRTGLDAGVVRLVIEFGEDARGPRRCIWGLDFNRRQYGPRVVTQPGATLRMTAATIALLAHGRGDRLPPEPCVATEGDLDLAAAVLEAFDAPRAPTPCIGVDRRAAAAF